MKKVLKVFGILLIVYYLIANIFPSLIAVPIAAWNSQQEWKNNMSNSNFQNEISSFDLNVKIPKPNSNLLELWKEEMAKIGLTIEFHPNFDIKNQNGFLPFKMKVENSASTNNYGNNDWLTGFELYISDFDKEEYYSYFDSEELKSIPENIKKIYDNAELDFFFSAKPQNNTSEFRMTWYAAATLAKLGNGILEEAYSGKSFIANNAIEYAIKKTEKAENELPDDKWKLVKFAGWN